MTTFARIGVFAAITLVAQAAHAVENFIAQTEDQKAMGYPDGRKIVRDSLGNLYVAYRAKSGARHQIFVALSTDGGTTWSVMNGGAAISDHSRSDDDQRVPSIAIDSADNLHVVWYGVDTDPSATGANQRIIKYQKHTPGLRFNNGWLLERKIIGNPSGYPTPDPPYWQEHPVIYVHSNDNLYVVWEGRLSGNQQAYYNTSTTGGATWSTSTGTPVYPIGPPNQSRPTIVVTSNGDMFVFAYGYGMNAQNIIWTKTSGTFGTFGPWSVVSSDAIDQRHVSAAIDASDNIHLVWRQQTNSSPTYSVIRYSKYSSGTFLTPVTISATANRYQLFPSISHYNGKLHVVWTETDDMDPGVAAYPEEEPTKGQIMRAYKCSPTCTWTKTAVTTFASYVWGSTRWSFDTMNGGDIDVVYVGGGPTIFQIFYQSFGALP